MGIQIANGEFAGYPIKIVYYTETYPPAREDKGHIDYWIITSDLYLSPAEIREAAHLRRHIENNVFNLLSHCAGTKMVCTSFYQPIGTQRS